MVWQLTEGRLVLEAKGVFRRITLTLRSPLGWHREMSVNWLGAKVRVETRGG
jgi:hypothetical protein